MDKNRRAFLSVLCHLFSFSFPFPFFKKRKYKNKSRLKTNKHEPPHRIQAPHAIAAWNRASTGASQKTLVNSNCDLLCSFKGRMVYFCHLHFLNQSYKQRRLNPRRQQCSATYREQPVILMECPNNCAVAWINSLFWQRHNSPVHSHFWWLGTRWGHTPIRCHCQESASNPGSRTTNCSTTRHVCEMQCHFQTTR